MENEKVLARAAANGLVLFRVGEIAKRARVSRGTVRNAIRHPQIVTAETRRRVLQAIGFEEGELEQLEG